VVVISGAGSGGIVAGEAIDDAEAEGGKSVDAAARNRDECGLLTSTIWTRE
jgi:hypothetical protein